MRKYVSTTAEFLGGIFVLFIMAANPRIYDYLDQVMGGPRAHAAMAFLYFFCTIFLARYAQRAPSETKVLLYSFVFATTVFMLHEIVLAFA